MKTKVTTLVIALIAFFSVNSAFAQNAHLTDVLVDGLTVTGKVAGLGKFSGTVNVKYVASVQVTKTCVTKENPGNGGEKVVPGQSKTETIENLVVGMVPGRNGHVNFSLTLNDNNVNVEADCPGNLVLKESSVVPGTTNGVYFQLVPKNGVAGEWVFMPLL
ncbi:hypothetical protein [Rufibacter soli]